MTRRIAKRIQRFFTVAALLAILSFVGHAARRHGAHSAAPASISTAMKVEHPPAIINDYKASGISGPNLVLRMTPDTVLASVNGHILTAATVFPTGSSDRNVSFEECEYFRQRAVDRELILQAARKEEISLSESQQQQLANLQRLRQQPGPGVIRNLIGGPQNLSFELLDDQAFMLQADLMEKSGASPNVTSKQVSNYYLQHISEFGELPADEPSRKDAWGSIDFKIRQTLSFSVRSDFQKKLADYMKRIETEANVQLTPLASFASIR
jgi:hypothetical protein